MGISEKDKERLDFGLSLEMLCNKYIFGKYITKQEMVIRLEDMIDTIKDIIKMEGE